MRISSLMTDPGYTPHFYRYRVFLAGTQIDSAVTADDVKRYALTLVRDEFGHPVLDKAGNQRTLEYWGPVRIEIDPQEEGDSLGGAVNAMCAES